MSTVRDSFVDLEKHRQRLEDNVKQLQKALQHWQTWDAEYEALKEEVESVSAADQAQELRRIHAEFDGELLNGREIDEVFGGPNLKSQGQIINLLERRIDYVTKNIESLQKQLATAENKYAAATVLSQPDTTDEDGQPITDIIEELDENDNVLSYRLNKPGESLPHVQKILETAGVTDLPDPESEAREQTPAAQQESGSKDKQPDTATPPEPTSAESETPMKKSVSFSDDTKVDEEPAPDMSWRAKRVEQIMNTAKEHENISKQAPIVPGDESPEDAALRQEMLTYSMSEVGAVVAELELEEVGSDDDSELDYDEGFDEDYDEDDEDDEDQYGRYKGSVITAQYRRRMLELEKKLGIKSHSSQAKPKAKSEAKPEEDEESSDDGEGIGRIVVKRDADASSVASKATPSKSSIRDKQAGDVEEKKGVRFASSLDIATEPDVPVLGEKKPMVEPLSDIVERSAPSTSTEPQPTKKASRFKKTRDNPGPASAVPKGPLDLPMRFMDQDRRPAPTGPEGTTIADTLVERESSSTVLPPDEVDESMAHREVADEYQRMRRKFIQRDGGFLKQDESAIQPVDDDDTQEPISRFKAARLSRQ